jgi:hypothetical protein
VSGDVSLGEIPPAKGGVKAPVLLDHDDYLPRYVLITEARCSDGKMADAFPLNPGRLGGWPEMSIPTATHYQDGSAGSRAAATRIALTDLI